MTDLTGGWRGAGGTAALGGVLVLVAGLIDAAALYVPGITLLLLGLGSVLWVRAAARGVSVVRELGARRVVEDEPLSVEVDVRAGRIAPPSGELHDSLLAQPAPLDPGAARTRVRIRARFGRRGIRLLGPPRLVIRDPLGLAHVAVTADAAAEEILVLPRIEPVLAPADGGGEQGTGQRSPALAAEVDIDGIRPHRPGTPASRIAWGVYARRGELHDRVLRADADARPLVVLDLRGASGDADADAAVRAAASLCVHLAERGGCTLLLPGERTPLPIDPALRGWPAAHARLALADGRGAPGVGALGARRGALLWVSARPRAEPPRGLIRSSGESRVLVVPGTLPGRRASFTVAGCSGYALGRLRRPGRDAALQGSAR